MTWKRAGFTSSESCARSGCALLSIIRQPACSTAHHPPRREDPRHCGFQLDPSRAIGQAKIFLAGTTSALRRPLWLQCAASGGDSMLQRRPPARYLSDTWRPHLARRSRAGGARARRARSWCATWRTQPLCIGRCESTRGRRHWAPTPPTGPLGPDELRARRPQSFLAPTSAPAPVRIFLDNRRPPGSGPGLWQA